MTSMDHPIDNVDSASTDAATRDPDAPQQQQSPQEITVTLPAGYEIPEKFRDNPGAIFSAYSELERAKGQQDPAEPAAPAAPATADPNKPPDFSIPEQPEEEPAPEQIAELDMDALEKEWHDNNESLTEATMADLKRRGINESQVQRFVQGEMEKTANIINEMVTIAGGSEDDIARVRNWAAGNLPPEERAQYNEMLESRDRSKMLTGWRALVARFKTSPAGATKIDGDLTPGAGAGYKDQSEMLADMDTDKYRTSEAEQNRVLEKMRNTPPGIL